MEQEDSNIKKSILKMVEEFANREENGSHNNLK